jgi:TRAP-type mannitol/chloroaromatic compound transport system permease small subunit
MRDFLFSIDKFSAWTGKAFAWCVLVMTLGVSYEIIVRKLFRAPTAWAFDLSYIMYGALFLMAGAYTLSRNGHVRGDVIYRLLKPRTQAIIEMILYFLLFFPGIVAMIIIGAKYAAQSWGFNGGTGEVSINSPAGVPISQFKSIIPIAATLLLVQGVAEVLRCIICIKDGQWPDRLHDVEELETVLLHQHEDETHEEHGGQEATGGAGTGGTTR